MAVTGQQIIEEAKTYLGVPYVYGGNSRKGVDCSSLVQRVMVKLGIKAPRTASEQWHWSRHITADQLQPGDMIFEKGSDGTATNPGHVLLYAGGGKVVEAPHTGTNVRVRSWSPSESGVVGYGRAPNMPTSGAPGNAQNASFSVPGGLLQLPDQVTGAFGSIEDFFGKLAWITSPESWVRIIAGIVGILLAIGALSMMASSA